MPVTDEQFLKSYRDTLREYREHRDQYSEVGRLNLVAVLGERAYRMVAMYDAAVARADAADLRAEALLRRVAALRAALPDPGALLLLADWLDATDRPGQGNEVQTDLRRWADAAKRAV